MPRWLKSGIRIRNDSDITGNKIDNMKINIACTCGLQKSHVHKLNGVEIKLIHSTKAIMHKSSVSRSKQNAEK